VAGVDRSPAPSAADYRAFSDGIDAALAGALGTSDDSDTAFRGEGDPGVVVDGTEGRKRRQAEWTRPRRTSRATETTEANSPERPGHDTTVLIYVHG
jgi:hypothetical protein